MKSRRRAWFCAVPAARSAKASRTTRIASFIGSNANTCSSRSSSIAAIMAWRPPRELSPSRQSSMITWISLGGPMDRRSFVSVAVMTAASYERVMGANERVNVGLIGVGGQGRGDWGRFLKQPDVDAGAVCDVYVPHLEKGLAMAGNKARSYTDFRKLIEQKDLDAVIVA